MAFVDEVEVEVLAGDGGNGAVAFRREKFRPLGGPSGGDGGNGGDIIFLADTRLGTLMDLRYQKKISAPKGDNGRGKDMYGRGGADKTVRVPVGTQVFDAASGDLIRDFEVAGQSAVIAAGGKGGRGNIHFATSADRAPRKAEQGAPGERRKLRLELKLLADVGLLGFPNVGKSTLIARVSKARPKIADYPFTTLTPNLGVVSRDVDRNFVVADIPGLIEGAAEGHGLGHRFLRHVERCRVLLHLVTIDPDPEREPVRDFDVLMGELERFDPELAARPMIVALSKCDLPDVRDIADEVREAMKERGHADVLELSAATGAGVEAALDALEALLAVHVERPAPRDRPLVEPAEPAEPSEPSEPAEPADDEGELEVEYVE